MPKFTDTVFTTDLLSVSYTSAFMDCVLESIPSVYMFSPVKLMR